MEGFQGGRALSPWHKLGKLPIIGGKHKEWLTTGYPGSQFHSTVYTLEVYAIWLPSRLSRSSRSPSTWPK